MHLGFKTATQIVTERMKWCGMRPRLGAIDHWPSVSRSSVKSSSIYPLKSLSETG